MNRKIVGHYPDYTVDLSLNEEFLHSLGKVIYRGAWLEAVVTELVEQLVNGTGVLTVIADINFTKTVQIARMFIHQHWHDGLYKRHAFAVLNAAEEAYRYRNIVAHAKWYAVADHDDKFVALRFRTRQELRQHDFADLDDIYFVADRLAIAEGRLLLLMKSPAFQQRRMFRARVDRDL